MKDKYDLDNSDGVLAAKYDGDFKINENNPLTKSDDQPVVTINLEGKNAESFMGDRGYEKVPTKMLAEEFELFPVNQYLPIPSGGSIKVRNLKRSEIWLGMTYAPQNSQVSKYTKLFLWEPMVNGNHAVMLEKLTYQVEGVIPMLLRKIGSIYDSAITPQYSHTNTYYNWNNYPSNGVLNRYRNK